MLSTNVADAQPKSRLRFVIYGKIKIDGGDIDGTRISIQQVHGKIKKAKPTSNGKFEFKLEYFHKYIISFSKKGYRTKKISVDTHVPENLLSEGYEDYKFNVTLMQDADDGNVSYYAQPVGAIIYDGDRDDFMFDTNYDVVIDTKLQAQLDDTTSTPEPKDEIAENVPEPSENQETVESVTPENPVETEPVANNDDLKTDDTDNKIDADRNKIEDNPVDNIVESTDNENDADRKKIDENIPPKKEVEEEKVDLTKNDNESDRNKVDNLKSKAVVKSDDESKRNRKALISDDDKKPKKQVESTGNDVRKRKKQYKKGETELRNEDADKLYPTGITIEIYKYPNKKVKKIIVNREGSIEEYKIIRYNWGGIYYFKNNKSVSQIFLSLEVKPLPGEETRTEFK